MMYKKILVPLDGSELSEQVIPHAQALAEKFESELLLIRVYQPSLATYELLGDGPTTAREHDKEILERVEQEVHAYLKRVKEMLPEGMNARCFALLGGSVTDTILDAAQTEGADLIVMSTHGRSGFSRWIYGSVASKVLQAAKCPIFLVRAGNHVAE